MQQPGSATPTPTPTPAGSARMAFFGRVRAQWRAACSAQQQQADPPAQQAPEMRMPKLLYVEPLRGADEMSTVPTLEHRPLSGGASTTLGGVVRKDWLRLLHKAANDALSPRDVLRCSPAQLHFLMPILLRLEHLFDTLTLRMAEHRFLRNEAYWWMRANPSGVHRAFLDHNDFRESLEQEFGPTAELLEKLVFAVPEIGTTVKLQSFVNPLLNPPAAELPLDEDEDEAVGVLSELQVKKKCSSGHCPFFVEFVSACPDVASQLVLLKPDVVTSDAIMTRLFELFNYFWRMSWIPAERKPVALSFDVVAGGANWGVIEVIGGAKSLRTFDFTRMADPQKFTGADMAVFLRTAVGGFIAGYILGLGDRHLDNVMMVNGNMLMQIDFKHCFDQHTKGVDAPCLAIPMRMKRSLQARDKWIEFKDRCSDAFCVLRRSGSTVTALCRAMFAGVMPPQVVEASLIAKLQPNVLEEKAVAAIPTVIELSVYSLKRVMKNALHNLALMRMSAGVAPAPEVDSAAYAASCAAAVNTISEASATTAVSITAESHADDDEEAPEPVDKKDDCGPATSTKVGIE
eukprot:TRINITY_DN228_c0_g1_i8.p1 TRINITY_DN228_c0_g1~~TRINITY_DN228_c0_g1_i8.p1  ORF type:complete len:573 (+),score=151.91 TRINITY_DN228_c0_g1_i8:38-1756(+)